MPSTPSPRAQASSSRGLTTTDEKDRLVQAVRIVRPEKRTVVPEAVYGESSWESVDQAVWRATWDAEFAAADPWRTEEMTLVTGVLLPVWAHLPQKRAWVRRVKAPDGRRWLGRVLDPADVAKLKTALGLSDTATLVAKSGNAEAMILKEGASIALAGGFWLRRARVMDAWRIEVVNSGTQRTAFQALGCFLEIVNYQPRVFVPTGADVLGKVLDRWPAESITAMAA